nr:hypothetical protein Iba_chr13cCG13540 [Ipomoea batatas]
MLEELEALRPEEDGGRRSEHHRKSNFALDCALFPEITSDQAVLHQIETRSEILGEQRRTGEGLGEGSSGHVLAGLDCRVEGSGLTNGLAQNLKQTLSSSSFAMSFNEWAEKLKSKMGHNEELINLVDKAKNEVELFFETAVRELGHKYENVEDIAHEATAIFIEKVASGFGAEGGGSEVMGSSSKNKYSKGGKEHAVVNNSGKVGGTGSEGEGSMEIQRGVEFEKIRGLEEKDSMEISSGQGSSKAVIESQNVGSVDSNKEVDGPKTCDEGSCSNMEYGILEKGKIAMVMWSGEMGRMFWKIGIDG